MGAPSSRVRHFSNMFCAQRITGRPAAPLTTPGVSSPFLRKAPLPSWAAHAHPQPHTRPQLQAPSATRSWWLFSAGPGICPGLGAGVAAAGWRLPSLSWSQNPTYRSVSTPASASAAAETAAAAAAMPSSPDAAPEGAAAGPKPKSKTKRRQQQQQRHAQRTADSSQDDAVLFIGFHPEELDVVRQRLPELLPLVEDDGGAAAADDGPSTALVDVTCDMLQYTVHEVLQKRPAPRPAAATAEAHGGFGTGGGTAVAAGRVVLLVGPAARDVGAQLNDLLAEWGVVPALIAAYQPKHESMPLRRLVAFLRDSHAAYYDLLQPVRVEPLEPPTEGSDPATATAAEEAEANATPERAGACRDHLAVLEGVRVVLCAAMDAGEVPSIHGHYRRDAGHVVVLDGLLTEGERRELLSWLTAPEHNHQGPPPEDKWEMVCVDREGARPTWGLQPHVLSLLRDQPPPPVVALQTRLAALYPEYDICHMPADQISGEYGNDEADTPLSSFVGNAVMAGDPCAWHSDADPTTVPPHSPWVHNFGYYHNRELSRPLFVSMLLYTNETWPEDYHAETLFLDPETQLGLFVRPAPGRVVLLEQDLPHRISAPSLEAPGPRYSLVWKLVLRPKRTSTSRGLRGEDEEGTGAEGAAAVAEEEEEGEGEDAALGCVAAGGEFHSICRPEWGEPLRIGSASSHCGVPAFRREAAGAGKRRG
ncbi:hypothetical protein PLESTM_001880600 [Pleodorina starrii]|nr:hypothetical protein PLESTM_001880600 [Pleodorina starrii]